MHDVMIVATSLDPDSRSQRLARIALEEAKHLGLKAELLDLREHELPLAGAPGSWDDARVKALEKRFKQHRKFLFCVPVYNYDVNAAAKNLLELVGGKWLEGATAGFVCSAGGRASYMSITGFANSLMLDYRVWIVPRFVYVTGNDWDGEALGTREPQERIRHVLESLRDGPTVKPSPSTA